MILLLTNSENLESLIRKNVFLGKKTSLGFEIVKCSVCNDYKTRGGFKFDNDGVFYSCFNCGIKTGFKYSNKKIPQKLKEVLCAFNIPLEEIDNYINLSFFNQKDNQNNTSFSYLVNKSLSEIEFPEKTVSINNNDSLWCEVAREYLKYRGLFFNDFPFYVSDCENWVGRLIIPYFYQQKIIYWQARALDDSIKPRYKNPSISKDQLFFNMDELYRYTSEPLFVTEGPLDSISIGKQSIALSGSNFNEFHKKELIKVSKQRKVIFIIDKNLNGYKLGKEILKHDHLEWYITLFPDNITDSNHCLQMYGKLWLINYITTSALKGFAGKTLLEVRYER